MPNFDLGDPYETYVKGLINTGLYDTYAEVVKDALRLHMDLETNSRRMATISAILSEGEEDIKAGRFKTYSPGLIDLLTKEVLDEDT